LGPTILGADFKAGTTVRVGVGKGVLVGAGGGAGTVATIWGVLTAVDGTGEGVAVGMAAALLLEDS